MPTPAKYIQLLDIAWVKERLKTVSPGQLAKEIGCPRSSVQWVIDRYFSKEEADGVTKERVHPKDKIK